MKIAIAQLNPIIGDITGNAQQILTVAQQAVQQGVDLLLTPELSLCGYPPRDLLLNPSCVKLMNEQLEDLAKKLPESITVLVGTVARNLHAKKQGEKLLFNSIALLQNNQVKKYFYKRLLPTYDVFDEDRYFESGKDSEYFILDGIKIGVTICEDLWNDEKFWGKRSYEVNPVAELAQLGVDLMINLSASPYCVGKQQLREAMLHHASVYYHIPFIYVNQVGGNDDLIFDGHSVGFDRKGHLVFRAKGFATDLISFEWKKEKNDLSRSNICSLSSSDNEEVFNALVLGVRDYVKKCGFQKVILGLSGGIDSALVATIATFAVGKENVIGVLMPSPYSSDHSIKDAEQLVTNLGITSYRISIETMMASFEEALNPLFAGTESGIAEENLQSRIRGNLLMAISNKFGYLLLSTGNKSEMAVGYCTLYGDMNGGLSVISDVPKTRVFSLCHWLNRHGEVIPKNVLTKPPSAELKPNQLDEDSLPPYAILDDILHRFIHQHQSPEDMINTGHDPEIIHHVIKLVYRAEFKRKQAPPGLKITDRAFGTGWRMPIASRWQF